MAKAPASDSIMTPDKMKPLLALSKREPLSAAIALTADGEGLLLLDKKVKPKKALSLLRAAAGKAKLQLNSSTLRFGRAEVDTDYDSTMVRLFINKDAPGNMRLRLIEVVKKASFQKVELNVDPSLEEEPEDEAAHGEEVPAAAPPPAPALDVHALKHMLAELIGRIPAAAGDDAVRRTAMLKVAGVANEQLKAEHAEAAATTIARLRQVLDGANKPAPAGGARTERWKLARAAWQEASETVDGQIAELQKLLRDSGDDELREIAEFGLNGVTNGHKVPLMAALMEVGAGSPESLGKAGPKVLAAAQAFRQHVETDERVAACDENPGGVTVTIRGTLVPALKQLEDALAAA